MTSRALPLLLTLACGLAVERAAAQTIGKAPDISKASWIWSPDGGPDGSGPVSYLRRKFRLAAPPEQATMLMTADNGYELFVNRERIAAELDFGGTWHTVERFRIESHLHEGANVICVRGDNLGGPGGVMGGLYVRTTDGQELSLVTDKDWLSIVEPKGNWTEPDHDDTTWKPAVELARHGGGPWGMLGTPDTLSDPARLIVDRTIPAGPPPPPPDKFTEPPADFAWPTGVVYVSGRAEPHSTPAQTVIWPIGNSQAFFEYDVPAPAVSGHQLMALSPAQPGSAPRVLVDAGRGLVAGPTCSYDGREILFAMAPEGEKWFHLYRIGADGSGLQALTSGPWHDYDPAYVPDGRIVFASTRIGCREEYHGNTAHSLFTLSPDRKALRALTYHIVADSEPEVAADGRIVFVRHDNFMERAKVETHIHAVYPDGTNGEIILGQNRGKVTYDRPTGAEDDFAWLRVMGFGCPAPLPDGRVACLSHLGLTLTGPRPDGSDIRSVPCDITPFGISALPDGRLLAATANGALAVVNLDSGQAVKLLEQPGTFLHSAAYLGPRTPPPVVSQVVKPESERNPEKTGVLFCQSVFDTKQTDGEWRRVRSIRVVMGRPFTLRSARHQYDHIGTEGVELGTVPLAPDGSFFVRVPADRPLFLQAVDGEGRPVVSELSWIYVRPGETRSCVGCHAHKAAAPGGQPALAGLRPPVDLLGRGRPHRFRANNAANGGVLNLQPDRFREVAAIDLHAQALLQPGHDPAGLPPGRETELRDWTSLLADPDPALRRSAAERLAILREGSTTGALAGALRDPDRGVRCAAALALAAAGSREALRPLLAALDDPAPEVAQAAAVALRQLTGHDGPFSAYALPAERAAQAQAWRDWVRTRSPTDMEAELVGLLGSEDVIARQLAVEALGHIGGEAARSALREYVAVGRADGMTAQLAAIRSLGRLRDEAAVALLGGILEQNLGDVPGVPFKSHELGWNAMPDHLAGAAAEALGRIGTPEAEAALVQAFGKLREFWFYSFRTADHSWLMGCHSSIPHYRILEALDSIGSSKAGPLAAGILRSVPMDPDRGLLYENDDYETVTSRVIARAGLTASVVETCLSILGDPDARPAADLVEAVTASPPAESVGGLAPSSRAAQLLAVVALQPEHAPRVRAAFERFRAQEASRERSWTCFFLARALGKLRDAGSVPVLRAALDVDPTEADLGIPDPPNVFLFEAMTPLYRAAAADALGRIGAPEAYPTLLAAATDYRNAMDVRQAAARGLGAVVGAEQLGELKRVADDYPETVTQTTLWEACAAAKARLG